MKAISRTRKCMGYLALALVLLIAVDRYYPAAMSMLNMECYFRRRGWAVKSNAVDDFLPGDIVTCRVSGLLPHVMIVSDQVGTNGMPLVIHNIGRGTKEDAYLLSNKIEGHFRCR